LEIQGGRQCSCQRILLTAEGAIFESKAIVHLKMRTNEQTLPSIMGEDAGSQLEAVGDKLTHLGVQYSMLVIKKNCY
jgi:hypothetical protein